MRRRAEYAVGTLTIGLWAMAVLAADAQDKTLWYRGYFDGQVTLSSGPVPGFVYQPSRPTTYPLNEHLLGDPLPCSTCGYYHRPAGWCRELGRTCKGNGTHYDKDRVFTPAAYPLPGQYWNEKQNHWTWSVGPQLGWPYHKYDQRTEPTGSIPMGRDIEKHLERSRLR